MAKKKPAKRWDWSEFTDVREKSPEERLERAIVRYRKDKLLSGQQAQLPDNAATIIPFPIDKAPADDNGPDPQATHDTQGNAGHASAAQRLWVSRARRKAARKSRRKRDWDRFTFTDPREKITLQECLEREKANYRKGKLLSGQITQPPDTAATIILFPSGQAQAADKLAAPSSDS